MLLKFPLHNGIIICQEHVRQGNRVAHEGFDQHLESVEELRIVLKLEMSKRPHDANNVRAIALLWETVVFSICCEDTHIIAFGTQVVDKQIQRLLVGTVVGQLIRILQQEPIRGTVRQERDEAMHAVCRLAWAAVGQIHCGSGAMTSSCAVLCEVFAADATNGTM